MKRRLILAIHEELLPELDWNEVVVKKNWYNFHDSTFNLVLTSPQCPEVPEGMPIPEVVVSGELMPKIRNADDC